ncbi:hypothetical protein ES703_40060 [subsurface metagenome]
MRSTELLARASGRSPISARWHWNSKPRVSTTAAKSMTGPQRPQPLKPAGKGLDNGREEKIPIYYKDRRIDTRRVDFIVEGCIVEIKAKREFDPEDYIQALSYLKASGYPVGLLINFGSKKAEFKRLVNSAGSDTT